MLRRPESLPTESTRLAAVIGDPITHSMSPKLHNAAFTALGLDWMYVACQVPKGQGGMAVSQMRQQGFEGLSVTMPHKAEAASAVDQLSTSASRLGVVNCVRREGDQLIGENTDGLGFVQALRSEMSLDPNDLRVIILGAGGAARAVALALVDNGAHVGVVNRSPKPARELVEIAGSQSSVAGADDIGHADLIVNATSLGMNDDDPLPMDLDHLADNHVIADLIYSPKQTALLRAAEDRGLPNMNGLGMLLHQAGEQFRLWTGLEPPIKSMAEAVGLNLE